MIVFTIAAGTRLLYWQDLNAQILRDDMPLKGMTWLYRDQAELMLAEGTILFPGDETDPGDARMVAHPPGYSILMATALRMFGELDFTLRLIQVLADAAAAVLVILIAAEVLPFAVAIIAGTLVALSPHFAYYSLFLMPDSMTAVPILLAVYVIIRASKRPRLSMMITAGALVGLSCWLRSNSLMLAPFVALAVLLLFERAIRVRYSLALIGTVVLVIAPITIRNWFVYDRFIPLSLGAGITFMKGIADYDKSDRFGLPLSDVATGEKEAEWYGRPRYAGHLWVPDGVERDHDRFARGLAIVRENPSWFLTVMLRRAGFMLRYNDFLRQNILYNTTIAPTISADPGFGHGLAIPDGTAPSWTALPAGLIADGAIVAPQAEVSLVDEGSALRIAGGDPEHESLLATAPIDIEKNVDYVVAVRVYLEQGPIDIKVQAAADPRITLAISTIPPADKRAIRRARKGLAEPGMQGSEKPGTSVVQVPFASGGVSKVRVVFGNNGAIAERPAAEVYRCEMFAIGQTPHAWTRYPRAIVRAVQKNVFKTERLLPLVLIGVGLLAWSRRARPLVILLVVPCYYLLVHSAFHTEYRYILTVHYFLFIMAAVALYCAGSAIKQGLIGEKSETRDQKPKTKN